MEPSLESIRDKVSAGVRLSEEDALALFRSRDIHAVGEMADFVNRRVNGDRVYFIVNRHINPPDPGGAPPGTLPPSPGARGCRGGGSPRGGGGAGGGPPRGGGAEIFDPGVR